MHIPPPLAVLALALAARPSVALAGSDETWVALGVPSLCAPPPEVLRCERLAFGSHLLLPGEDIDISPAAPPDSLALAALLGWLEEDAGRRKLAVRYHPSVPPLLVRGDAAAVAQARSLVDELSAAGAARTIELRAWLVEGEAEVATTHPDRATFTRCVGSRAPWATASVTSGGSTVLGARRTTSYVAGYSVEVATDSGVADPTLGRIASGRTLHLRACRVRGGAAVHLEGLLDLAPKFALADFESGTPELGVVQVPTVPTVQVAFSGVVDSGALLAVVIRGAGIEPAAWTLWLEARTRPDAPGTTAPPRMLRCVDLALLESRAEDLPLPRPGFGIEFPAPAERALLRESLSASSVAEIGADSSRGSSANGRGPRAAALWFPGFLIAGADDTATWSEIDALVAGSERDCLASGEIALQYGTLRVLAPMCARCPTRVLAGTERTQLVDYDVQVAQDTWMPHPRTDHIFDGVCVQGHFDGATFSCSAWRASSTVTRELDRKQLGIARLPLVERVFAGAAAELVRAAPRTLLEVDGELPALALEIHAN